MQQFAVVAESEVSVDGHHWSVPLTLLIYSIICCVGGLVDSSESVPVCFAALLLCLTLRSPCVLISFVIICCAVIIYCVEFEDFAVEIVAVNVHDE